MKGMIRALSRSPKRQPAVRRVRIPIKALQVTITDPGAAIGYGGAAFAGLPEGNVLIVGAVANIVLSSASAGIIATFTANYAVGTTTTSDNSLTSPTTDNNIIPSTAVSAATAKVSPLTRGVNATPLMLDNTANDQTMKMNIIVPDASISAGSTMQVDGELYLAYVIMGDDNV